MAADESTISWGPSPTFGELVSGGGGGGTQLVPAETELGKARRPQKVSYPRCVKVCGIPQSLGP